MRSKVLIEVLERMEKDCWWVKTRRKLKVSLWCKYQIIKHRLKGSHLPSKKLSIGMKLYSLDALKHCGDGNVTVSSVSFAIYGIKVVDKNQTVYIYTSDGRRQLLGEQTLFH